MTIWHSIRDALDTFGPASIIDIIVIAVIIYLALLVLKGTTAMSLLRGIVMVVVGVVILAQLLNLTVLDWLIRYSLPAVLIAIPIVFQSEIRRFLERLGRTSRWPWPGRALYEGVVDTIADASLNLAEKRHGAIIVVERETGAGAAAFAGRGFTPPHWVDEVGRGTAAGTCYTARTGVDTIGFACHSVNRRGWIGPMATDPERQRGGVGRAMLGALCADLEASGVADADIAWVGPVGFYAKAGARVSRVFRTAKLRL